MEQLITNVGFPIACCIGLGMFVSKLFDRMQTDSKEDKERLYEEIKYNREVNGQLLETNKVLADNIKSEVREVKSDIKDIKEILVRESKN